ncbi:MAG: DUF2953 domain-containing protein [Clostridia bacterium]|nr:DUF2953 domain-containing protein [Clostridia bacterium]
MTPLWWILIGIGGLIGLVLLLLAAILFTRTAVMVRYNEEGIRFKIRVIGIPITLYPRKEKKKKEKSKNKKEASKKEKPPAKQEKEAPKQKKKSLTDELKHSLKEARLSDYIEILRTILSDFVGKFGFERLILHISVGGDDAMKIAMTYGRLNAALHPILGALAAADKLDKCDVQITPDFTSEEFRAEGDAVFSVRLWHGLHCILKLIQKL